MQLAVGLLLPFLGTTLGAACVFFMKGQMKPLVQKMLRGICVGSDGGGIGVVASDSGNGYVGGDGGNMHLSRRQPDFYLEFCFCLEWTGQYRISIWEQNVRRGLSAL